MAISKIPAAGIAADAITAAKLGDNVIDSEHYAADSIDAEHLAPNSVNTDSIIDDAVRTAHIQDSQVTVAKLAANSVDSSELINGSVDRVHLAADIVDGTKIADDVINSEHLVAGSIDTEHLGDDQVTAAKLANSINTDIATGPAALPKAGGTMTGHTLHGDNINQKFGAGSDLQIYHNGSNSYINNTTGSLYIRDSAGDIYIQAKNNEHSIVANNDGSVDIYYDNAKKFETTAAGVTVTGALAVTGTVDGIDIQTLNTTASAALPKAGGTVTGIINLNDNVRARFGTSGDMSIFHDGSNSYIENTGDGDLIIQDQTGDVYIKGKSGENSIVAHNDGAVELYHNNVKKMETNAAGINFPDNSKLLLGNSDDSEIYFDGTDLYLKSPSEVLIRSNTNENMIKCVKDAQVNLYYNNAVKIATASGGVDVTGNIGVSGTVDGVDIQTLNTTASAALPKAGYTGTTVLNIANAKYQGGDVASGARMTLKYLSSDPALKLIGGGSSTTLELLTGNNSSNYAIKVVDENSAATVFSVRKDGGAETSGIYDMHLTGRITGALGSVLQVIEAVSSTAITFANDWNYDDVISANITPSSTSSKVYVFVLISGASLADGSGGGVYPSVKARVLAGPDANFDNHATNVVENLFNLYMDNNQTHRMGQISLQCFDSPNSTAEQKYLVQAGNHGGSSESGTYSGMVNRSGGKTKIVLMEIGA